MQDIQRGAPAHPRVLVVEDELMVAMLLEQQLDLAGYEVVGPVARLDEAMVAARQDVDIAVLDVNLRGEMVFPAARILLERGVPVLFCSGYTSLTAIPPEFASVPQVAKPYEPECLLATVESMLRR